MSSCIRSFVLRSSAADLLSGFSNEINTINADPPYNTGRTKSVVPEYTQSEAMASKGWQNFKADWDCIEDYLSFSLEWMEAARDALKVDGNLLIWGTLVHNLHHVRYAVDRLGMWAVQCLYWNRTNPFPNLAGKMFTSSTECVLWIRKSQKKKSYYDKTVANRYPLVGSDGFPLKNLRDYFVYPSETWVGSKWKHPSRKPISVTKIVLDAMTPKYEDVKIVDPFAGSGTTGVAAREIPGLQGEVWLGDLDRGYVKEILSRRLFEQEYPLAIINGG
jgi:site-specific DNA-methyltransferase (adenine-specific)